MDIRTVTSEAEMEETAFQTLRQYRQVPMMMEYLREGARMFYGFYDNVLPSEPSEASAKYWEFFRKFFAPAENKKIAFISMGCGNAANEVYLLQQAVQHGYRMDYFGVDSSMAMLEMAAGTLSQVDIQQTLICADFGTARFLEEIQETTKDYDIRIFAFFEATIGNIEQDYLADIMADIMQDDDYLWADVVVRPDLQPKTDMQLFNEFQRDYNDNAENNSLDFLPLARLGMRKDQGKFVLEMVREDNLGALRFKFLFQLTELVEIRHKGRRVTFLPNSEVLLFNIRAYDADGFINFFSARKFVPVGDERAGEGGGLFLFRKV